METDGRDEQAMPREVADRIAGYLSQQDGVTAATVTGTEGQLLASAGADDPQREAALAAFICERAEEISQEGDLRGMGKLVAESEFQQLALAGPTTEGLVIRLQGRAAVLVTGPAGQLARAATATSVVSNRYGKAAGGH